MFIMLARKKMIINMFVTRFGHFNPLLARSISFDEGAI